MTKYKVLQYFQWGQLPLDKGQTLAIEDLGKNEGTHEQSLVKNFYYPEKSVMVATKAVESMVFLKRIEKISE